MVAKVSVYVREYVGTNPLSRAALARAGTVDRCWRSYTGLKISICRESDERQERLVG